VRHGCLTREITFGSSTDESFKATTRMYKIRPAKKCGYKGNIESTKNSAGNSNIPEKVETTRREDAKRDTTRVST
jgi:hypothetical protein